MVRFVDLGDQILQHVRFFAWYDTIRDEFISFDTEQAFSSWDNFEDWFKGAQPHASFSDIERFRGLFPGDWEAI